MDYRKVFVPALFHFVLLFVLLLFRWNQVYLGMTNQLFWLLWKLRWWKRLFEVVGVFVLSSGIDHTQEPSLMLGHFQTWPVYFDRVKIAIFQTPGKISVFDSVLFDQPVKVILVFHRILLFIQAIPQRILHIKWLYLHILVKLGYIYHSMRLFWLYSNQTQQQVHL